jgi:hypothetical protein
LETHKVYFGIIGHLEQTVIQRENILYETDNYMLSYECESVNLCIKNKEIPLISVGDHYGNPTDGLISKQEDYLVSVGCGINIAYIKNIYNDGYRYYCEYEAYLNDSENTWWVDSVFQLDEEPNEVFRFQCSNDEYDLAEYTFNTNTNEIKLIKVIEELPTKNS